MQGWPSDLSPGISDKAKKVDGIIREW